MIRAPRPRLFTRLMWFDSRRRYKITRSQHRLSQALHADHAEFNRRLHLADWTDTE